MKRLLYISLLFPLLLQGQSYQLKPDVKAMFRTVYENLISPTPADDSTVFYVDATNGDDSRRGWGSPDSAWQTLAKVGSETFDTSDQILLKRDEEWRDSLKIPSSGIAGAFIRFGTYGSGDNPRILGSDTSTSWVNITGNIWGSPALFGDPRGLGDGFDTEIHFIKLDGTHSWGDFVANTGLLDAEYKWTWSGDSIYVFAATDPDTRYTEIEIPQRQNSIEANNQEFFEIDSIDMHYGIYQGISYDWSFAQLDKTGLIIDGCEIAWMGGEIYNTGNEVGFGIDIAYTDMIVRNCTIHEAGRRPISWHIFGSGFTITNMLVENCVFFDGYHNTGPDLSVGSGSFTASINGVIIRNNLIYDSAVSVALSEHIFLQNHDLAGGAADMENIEIYNNISVNPSNNSINMEGTQSVFVYNNTFYNHETTSAGNQSHIWVDANNDSVVITNNLFFTNLATDNNFVGMELFEGVGQDQTNIYPDYNLYWRTADDLRMIVANATQYFRTEASFDAMRGAFAGWEANSQYPADGLIFNNDYRLRTGSPAIDSGVDLSAIFTDDFYGDTRTGDFWIGAVQSSRDGDTVVSFIASKDDDRDSLIVTAVGFPGLADSLVMVAKEGDATIGRDAGTQLYAGSDTGAISDTYFFDASTDTIITVELHQRYNNVWSLNPNTDTTTIDSTAVAFSAAYLAVLAAMTTEPGADTAAQQNIMFNRILDTADLDLLYVSAQSFNSGGEADINWMDPGTNDLTEVGAGSLTWTKYQGYTGDGTNYLTTGWNPSTDATNYTTTSGAFGIYLRIDLNESTYAMAAEGGGNVMSNTGQFSDNFFAKSNNDSFTSAGETDGDKFFVVSRTASNAVSLYTNGVSSVDATTASVGLPNDILEILAKNGASQSNNQFAVAFVSGGLTVAQQLEINAAVEAYMDFLGTGVQ